MHRRIPFSGSFFRTLLFVSSLLLCGTLAFGQAPRVNTDSLRAARQHVLDSAKAAREAATAARTAALKSRTDSLAAVRKYRESRHYRDSVADAREARTAAQKAATQARLDSSRAAIAAKLDSTRAANTAALETVRNARQQALDSAKAVREATTTAAQERLKARSDSLAAVRAYRTSKRYTDSVAVVRRSTADSIKIARADATAAAAAVRQARLDSATAVRKQATDSATAVRTRISDSVKVVRKARADSFATAKVAREKATKKKQEKKIQDMNLAIDIKVKKKREAYSNTQMLKKKWGLPRQIVQNTFTRYNWYFNADRRMDEALQNMVRARREGYDSLLTLFPFDPDRDSALLKTDMDSIIQKASLGIQIHDPRTKWGDDLYLLLGQAYFYKGDYDNAAKSFRYILSLRELDKKQRAKDLAQRKRDGGGKAAPSIVEEEADGPLDFLKHQAVHNEALLWLARTYTESGRIGEAESVLDLLIADPQFPERLEGRYALERAYIALEAGNTRDAVQHLGAVVADASLPDWLRQRAGYLGGQLAQRRGDYASAAESYRRTIALKPKVEMDFYARRNLAYCLMEGGGAGEADAIAMLKELLSDNKYLTYHEQVYFVLGRLSANTGARADAETYLRKSIASPKSTRRQKALSFAALGDVYYAGASYEAAKAAYDSAAILGGRGATDPALTLAARRAKTLDAVAGPARTIRTTDSLLTLAAMSERDQRAAVRRYIRGLEQQRADSLFRVEAAGTTAAMAAEADGRDGGGDGGTWYFANAAQMQQGYNEFRRKWGTRPLADNWRRASALASYAGAAAGGAPDGSDIELDESGLPTEAGLMAAIPRGAGALDLLRSNQRRAYIDLSDGYIQSLEDYTRATASLDTLDRRYAAHEHGAEALYLRYLAALRQDQMPVAQTHATALVARFPESKWAALVRPSEESTMPVAGSDGTPAVYYEETYTAMQDRRYSEVIQRTREGRRRWADPRYGQRFTIIEATALAGSEQWSAADSLLGAYLAAGPADSLKPWAEAVRQYIQRNRPASPTAGATASSVGGPAPASAASPAPPAPLTAPAAVPAAVVSPTSSAASPAVTPTAPSPSPAAAAAPPAAAPGTGTIATVPTPPDAPAAFSYNGKEEHFFVFSFGRMEPRAMGVRVGLADFNSFKFSGKSLASSVEMLTATKGLVITRRFADAAAAQAYAKAFRETSLLTREYKSSEYQTFVISATNYKKLVADRSTAGYLTFYGKHYK